MIHVRTRFQRADPEHVARLAEFSTATIHEAQGRLGALNSDIKPIDRSMSFCGSAVTVVCAPRDNIMLQVAIHYAQPGDVLVVSAGEFAEAGTFGDVLGNAMKAKGLAALVTDSGVRDTDDLIELGLPVFSRSVCIKGTAKDGRGHHAAIRREGLDGPRGGPGRLEPAEVCRRVGRRAARGRPARLGCPDRRRVRSGGGSVRELRRGVSAGNILDSTPDDLDSLVDVNLRAVLHLTRILLPGMVERDRGHIINISSIAGIYNFFGHTAYHATKAAVHQLSRQIRNDTVGRRIRVTEICPIRVETEIFGRNLGGTPEALQLAWDTYYEGYESLTTDDIVASVDFAVSAPQRMNVSMIEILPTFQVPGGLTFDRREQAVEASGDAGALAASETVGAER